MTHKHNPECALELGAPTDGSKPCCTGPNEKSAHPDNESTLKFIATQPHPVAILAVTKDDAETRLDRDLTDDEWHWMCRNIENGGFDYAWDCLMENLEDLLPRTEG